MKTGEEGENCGEESGEESVDTVEGEVGETGSEPVCEEEEPEAKTETVKQNK